MIGIVTPYGAQKIRIRVALQTLGLLHRVHVGTVHSFQSGEYPCIIFDTTEGPGVPIRQFTSNTWGRDGMPHEATRLLNVAHSRARDKLIYIANVDYINERYLPAGKALSSEPSAHTRYQFYLRTRICRFATFIVVYRSIDPLPLISLMVKAVFLDRLIFLSVAVGKLHDSIPCLQFLEDVFPYLALVLRSHQLLMQVRKYNN